ncbi:hypothetical protein BU23DRAFT_573164 [Bimuria novae-zelandiae CBS 107.79]|uniref:Uncharacterized protein n=1 Tax=Bimuria novae-zelandiae CBS 107.79 TaxID=1447943 RepID=A0A6A5URZ1_9PLEO|nr:hypothetical protein BU23DRAFT_573164 [Bimuria novae-zelandiae CBS 107.79]
MIEGKQVGIAGKHDLHRGLDPLGNKWHGVPPTCTHMLPRQGKLVSARSQSYLVRRPFLSSRSSSSFEKKTICEATNISLGMAVCLVAVYSLGQHGAVPRRGSGASSRSGTQIRRLTMYSTECSTPPVQIAYAETRSVKYPPPFEEGVGSATTRPVQWGREYVTATISWALQNYDPNASPSPLPYLTPNSTEIEAA